MDLNSINRFPPLRPDRPTGADGMVGAELAAPEAGAAEVALVGEDAVLVPAKHPHRAHIDAETAVLAEVGIDINLDRDGRGGRYLQFPSHRSRMLPVPGAGSGRQAGKQIFYSVFRIKTNRFVFEGKRGSWKGGLTTIRSYFLYSKNCTQF